VNCRSLRRGWLAGVGSLLLALTGAACNHVPASYVDAPDDPPPIPAQRSGWVVDWRDAHVVAAIRAIDEAFPALTEIDFFRLHFDPQGEVLGGNALDGLHLELAQRAARSGLRQLITLVNDVIAADGKAILKDPDVPHRILNDPQRRRRLVDTLRDVVRRGGYDGLDLDLENLYARDRDAFSLFVAELAEALHADKRRLVVTVQPQTRHEQRDGPGAQDLAAIARHADEVRVMAYHVHHDRTAPGPPAPLGWLERLIEHQLKLVPADKLSIAFYVGGWHWTGHRARQIGHADAVALAQQFGVAPQWSDAEAMPYFRAQSADGTVEVWFENACSLIEKTRLAARHGVESIALWHIGKEDPTVHAALHTNTSCPHRSREANSPAAGSGR
jgi:spore germination protein YaaH